MASYLINHRGLGFEDLSPEADRSLDRRPTGGLPYCPFCGVNAVPVLHDQDVVLCARCLEGVRFPTDAVGILLELNALRRTMAAGLGSISSHAASSAHWASDMASRQRRMSGEGY